MNMPKTKWERLAAPTFLALRKGHGLGALRELIVAHCDELSRPVINEGLMHAAARGNDLIALQLLFKAGVPVDAVDAKGRITPLHAAALDGCMNAAQWLLNHGASCEGVCQGAGQTPLIAASMKGRTDVVRVMLSHGANVNAPYELRSGSKCTIMNALRWAIANGHLETAELLRAHGAVMPDESPNAAPPGTDLLDPVLAHLETKLGNADPLALVEIVPSDLPITINVFRTHTSGTILTTTGMSERCMRVPSEEKEDLSRAELVLHLPKHWPLDATSIGEPDKSWPISWLRMLGRFPHERGTFLGRAVVVGRPDLPSLSAPGTAFEGALVIRNIDDYGQLVQDNGLVVSFYDVLPLYREEVEFALSTGIEKLVDRLDAAHISEEVNPNRVNVGSS